MLARSPYSFRSRSEEHRATHLAELRTVAQRLEFFNEWLPWRDQDVDEGHASLLITLKWKVMGAGKNAARNKKKREKEKEKREREAQDAVQSEPGGLEHLAIDGGS